MVMAAVTGVLGALGGQLANQNKGGGAAAPPARLDTSTQAIALAHDGPARKAALKNAREERAHALLTDPQIQGIVTLIGGTMLACNMPYHHDRLVNGELRAITASAVMLMALGRAGVGDMTTLALAAGTGAVLSAGAMADEIPSDENGGGSGGSIFSRLIGEMLGGLQVIM